MNAGGNRGLAALVIFMGVIVAIGLVVVVVTIASRLINAARSGDHGAPPASFDTVDVPISEGCQVVETDIEGDRLVLRLGTGGRCNQLLIVDLGTGALAGRINLVPAP